MFTPDAQSVIDQAKDVVVSRGEHELTVGALATAVVSNRRGSVWLAQGLEIAPTELQQHFAPPDSLRRCPGKLTLSNDVRQLLHLAKGLVEKLPSSKQPALIGLPHLVCAVACSLSAKDIPHITVPSDARALDLLAEWLQAETEPPSLGALTERLRALRRKLLDRLYGQDHAIHQFVDGLFNVEVVREADTTRRAPAGLFVFSGPPGVGKTYLAELGASHLDRPFKRFDMSAYAREHEAATLIGTPPMYKGAEPGTLTDFVQRNPDALLLFDEIEKAHHSAVHLFLQILDAGRLQDKFTEQTVEFRNTLIIFTTNVGRTLYENQNRAGVHKVNAAFYRTTLLDALRAEADPWTHVPYFPAALCSRLATGYPILFNHLRVSDLAQIAAAEMNRTAKLLEQRHGPHFVIADEVPLALVTREGANADARTVKAQAEAFLKTEVFKACQLFTDTHVDAAFERTQTVSVELDPVHAGETAERLFQDRRAPSVLFVGDELLGTLYHEVIPAVDWALAASAEQAFDVLAKRDIDLVLLDLSLQPRPPAEYANLAEAFYAVSTFSMTQATHVAFDHSPPAAHRFATGQQLLEQLHVRSPETPVYLFALQTEPALDEELLLACVRAGGARGAIRTAFGNQTTPEWCAERDAFQSAIEAIGKQLRIEQMAEKLAHQHQVVAFDTAPLIDPQAGECLRLRCRNFRLVRAVRSDDASALISDLERPATQLTDVLGAASAKAALALIRDWLRDPKRYAAAGVEPPRGVLLTGPPGTGKTMLARALAGESESAFLVESATNFVTMWQGSGPENIRNLFTRAGRYAPSIVFIDEIDAIGRKRTAGPGSHGEEMALNALLVEMDGFARSPTQPVIVIAASNRAELLDRALLRRFSRQIEVELPTRADREQYLRTRLGAKARHGVSAEMIERLAAQDQGLSIADLERILAEAAVMAIANDALIDDGILSEAFEKITLGEAEAGSDPRRTAYHEAGHALLMCLTGRPPIYVTTVGRGSFGGYAAFEDREERRAQTKGELEALLCQMLGGREAECLYYGENGGQSTGPATDLKEATRLAEAMVYDYGMSPEVGFVRIDRRQPVPAEISVQCHAAVRALLEAQTQRAQQLLSNHRSSFEAIATALLERNRLLRHELLELLTPRERELAEGSAE